MIKFGLIPGADRPPAGDCHFGRIRRRSADQYPHREPKNALVKQYQALFAMEGVELEILPSALHSIAKLAMERKTGARGLRSIVERSLLDTMYQLPDLKDVKKVVINEQVIERGVAPKLFKADGSLYQAGETETKAVKKAAKRPAA